MSKILKSFGMAALLVALLAGTGAADTAPAIVEGEVQGMIMSISTPPVAATFDSLIQGMTDEVTQENGIGITTTAPWILAVRDTNHDTSTYPGHMRTGSYDLETPPEWTYDSGLDEDALAAALQVWDYTIGTPAYVLLTGASQNIKAGASTNNLEETPVELKYKQAVALDDPTGDVRIDLTYTLAWNP